MALHYALLDRLEKRRITKDEGRVISFLFEKAELNYDLDKLFVKPMMDRGMGSLLFVSNNLAAERRLGREAADCFFRDSDGVFVSAVLNLDQDGELFELDVWKVDYSPLLSWPDVSDIHKAPEWDT